MSLLRLPALYLPLVVALAVAQPGPESDPQTAVDPLDPAAGAMLDVDLDSLEGLATSAYQEGRYLDAASLYLDALSYDIGNSNAIYNLACCYGLLGEPELAAACLRRAFAAGFDDIGHARRDPDFDLVRSSDGFAGLLDSLEASATEAESETGLLITVRSPAYHRCRVRLPADFDSTRTYPLVVGLHGFGSNPDRFIRLWRKFGDNPRFIYACPQAPYAMSAGRDMGYSWFLHAEQDSARAAAIHVASEDYVVDAVLDLKSRYATSGIFLLGFSQGCALTYTAGMKYHELFDGLVCFGGWLETDWLTEETVTAAQRLRVYIGHGTEDRVVQYEAGASAAERLQALGFDVVLAPFEGGHRIPEEEARKAIAWLSE
jgi:phospholipase/carboxylesterase